jgi:parvulin-like peptidyl-prolyl isomerase
MAKIHSQHASAASGGELGTFQPGELAAPFDIAFALQSGEISDPVRSDKGFHIITVQKGSSGGSGDLLRIKAQIRDALFEEKAQQLYTEWLDILKDNAYIELK